MADLTVTAAQVGLVFPQKSVVRDYIATETITAGQAVYFPSTGKVGIADANAAGKQQFRGIALNGGGAGQGISVLHEGEIFGFTLTSLNADALVFLSDTAGALADAAGTMTVRCGRVKCLSDANLTKVLYIWTNWAENWS